MVMPKPRPKTQNNSPTISRRCPFTPRNETEERSGSFSAASPPSSAGGSASAWPAVRSSRVAKVAEVFAKRFFANQRPTDARLAFQVRIKILLKDRIQGSRRVILLRQVNRPLQDSIRYGYGRHQSSEHAPNTLPPPGIIIKRSADLAASENLCRRHIAPGSDYTPPHKPPFIAPCRKSGQ